MKPIFLIDGKPMLLPDGSPAYTFTDNRLTLYLPAQVFGTAGLTKVQGVITQNSKQISVFSFEIICQGACAGEPAGHYTNLSAWLREHAIAPEKGVDYWTPADIAEIQAYIDTQLGVIEHGAY